MFSYEIRSLTVAALLRMCIFADGYRAATVRERSPKPEFPPNLLSTLSYLIKPALQCVNIS